jgi:phosphoribosylformylglycinamidine synthase
VVGCVCKLKSYFCVSSVVICQLLIIFALPNPPGSGTSGLIFYRKFYMYQVTVRVILRESILDPQGKAAGQALQNLGINEVANVRIGKLITFDVQAASTDQAEKIARNACSRLLANEVMEDFEISIARK